MNNPTEPVRHFPMRPEDIHRFAQSANITEKEKERFRLIDSMAQEIIHFKLRDEEPKVMLFFKLCEKEARRGHRSIFSQKAINFYSRSAKRTLEIYIVK